MGVPTQLPVTHLTAVHRVPADTKAGKLSAPLIIGIPSDGKVCKRKMTANSPCRTGPRFLLVSSGNISDSVNFIMLRHSVHEGVST